MIMEVLECLQVTDDLNLGFERPSILTLKIMYFVVVAIKVVMMEEVGICLKRPYTPSIAILDHVLTVMGDVDIGLILANLPPHKPGGHCRFSGL